LPTTRLVAASTAYLVWATGAGLLAIARNMPAGFGGMSSGLSVTNDFLIGMGTALSPPLWWMLAQAFFTLRTARTAGRSRGSIIALIAFGAMECIGALGEPVTLPAFSPSTFDPLLAVTQLGMIVLPLLTAIFGLRHFR
jgi:hypothetical protein